MTQAKFRHTEKLYVTIGNKNASFFLLLPHISEGFIPHSLIHYKKKNAIKRMSKIKKYLLQKCKTQVNSCVCGPKNSKEDYLISGKNQRGGNLLDYVLAE